MAGGNKMPLGETITVINKSGKVVSTGKHLVNVFKEARSAYRERKAEIKAERDADLEERRARKMLRAATIRDEDTRSHHSHRSHRSHASKRSQPRDLERSKSHRHPRPPMERGYTDSFYLDEQQIPRTPRRASEQAEIQRKELVRRRSDGLEVAHRKDARSYSEPHIDMDLAYGDLPPPYPVSKHQEEEELREKVSALQNLLDEANCVQHSAVAMIENLQKNPDALAAVGLALAEVSTLVTKMAPGALASLKGAFPAVMALLASPQFMIAAGVGVGVTIVALGGYKIIKKIQNSKQEKRLEEPLELEELETKELSRIELWRRGIADAEADSSGTTVDGEFITPGATKHLVDEGVLDADDMKSTRSRKTSKDKGTHKSKPKAPKSTKSSSTHRSKTVKEKSKKEPSGLRMLFRSNTHG